MCACRSRESHIRDRMTREADSGISRGDVRLAVCGFQPLPTLHFRVEKMSFTFEGGEHDKGPAAMDATWVTDSGARCEGRVAFDCAFDDGGPNHPDHWDLRNIRRVGPAAAVLR